MNLFNLLKRPILRGGYLTLALTFFLMSCATTPPPDISHLQWPLPPDEARVKYVRWWIGEPDLGRDTMSILLGEGEWIFRYPRGVTTDSAGNMYVADTKIGVVFIFDLQANKLRIIGGEEGGLKLRRPVDVAVDDEGRIYISDVKSDKIFIYNKENKLLGTIGYTGEFVNPAGLAVDNERKRLYIANLRKNSIYVYDISSRSLVFKIGSERGSSEEGYFAAPQGISLDRDGNLYVADTFNFRVQSFTPEGKFRFKFGKAGDERGHFGMPSGVAVDSDGNIYVSDLRFNNVQVFNKDGKYIFTIGEYGDEPGKFAAPSDVYIDKDDKIYVPDRGNRRLQVFQYLSEKYKKEQAEQPIK